MCVQSVFMVSRGFFPTTNMSIYYTAQGDMTQAQLKDTHYQFSVFYFDPVTNHMT